MGLNGFIFDDINSMEYGVFISAGSTFDGAERDFEMIDIPGRNGALIIENNRWKNKSIGYPCFIMRDIESNLPALRAALSSKRGYKRLSDTYNPGQYRLATFVGPFEPKMGAANRYGRFTLDFNAKPQRFLLSGEEALSIAGSGQTVVNPTLFEALPLFELHGTTGENATITINGVVLSITGIVDGMLIDCEMQQAFTEDLTRNLTNRLNTFDFPTLLPGDNVISFAGLTSMKITPRWWTL